MFLCVDRITPDLCQKYFSCAAFAKLKQQWSAPTFLPRGGYSFPFTMFGAEQPNERWFYDFGLYLSPRGTITRMHIDGSRTHAILCLVRGQKQCLLLPPSTAYCFDNVFGATAYHDSTWGDMRLAEPCFRDAPQSMKDKLPMQALECTLNAGEVLFIPKSWMHEVHTTESSFMLTYNFLHGIPDYLGSLFDQMWFGWGGARYLRKAIS